MDTYPSRERVEEMEKRLNRLSPLVDRYARATEAFIQAREDMKALFAYYGSPEWYADLDAQARGEIPPEAPCGVAHRHRPQIVPLQQPGRGGDGLVRSHAHRPGRHNGSYFHMFHLPGIMASPGTFYTSFPSLSDRSTGPAAAAKSSAARSASERVLPLVPTSRIREPAVRCWL